MPEVDRVFAGAERSGRRDHAGIRKFPLRYDPLCWGAVFPLGMYTVCTARLSHAIDVALLISISTIFVYVALAARLGVALGLAFHLLRRRPS